MFGLLDENRRYLNAGNVFSKTLLFKNSFDFDKEAILLFVKDETQAKLYEKLLNYYKINPLLITTEAEFFSLKMRIPGIYILTYKFFYTNFNKYQLEKNSIVFKKGEKYDFNKIVLEINDFGYNFADFLEPGSFNKKGDLFSYMPFGIKDLKISISFWGNEIEEIVCMKKDKILSLQNVEIGRNIKFKVLEEFNEEAKNFIDDLEVKIVLDNLDLETNNEKLIFKNGIYLDLFQKIGEKQIDLGISDFYIKDILEFKDYLSDRKNDIKIFTKNEKIIQNFLDYNDIFGVKVFQSNLNFLKSFCIKEKNIFYITDDNLNRIFVKKRIKKSVTEEMESILSIKEGDFIVHIDHGIGVFRGIVTKKLIDFEKEYIEIEYLNNEKLFVPITESSRVSKYVGAGDPKLTPLNSGSWQKDLAKATKEAREFAEKLMNIYAQRKLSKGYSFVENKEKMQDFQNKFPYVYTDDQQTAIKEVLENMTKTEPMDRLLSGDVGFGKTEVAFNAIYNAFLNKKQSILVSPLVVLAYEHYESAIKRFSDFGLKIEILTRFQTQSKTKIILEDLKNGKIDLVIGTHRILNEKIEFKNLGLIVIDEEHKFGVKDKEKIKGFRSNIDVLSMSATPIPRTLNMALASIRDLSILKNAPFGRQAISTIVMPFNENIIKDVCKKEFDRKGQVFFVNNRILGIERLNDTLQKLFPNKKIIITHSKLPGDELEDRIMAFKRKEYDILLTTTVIENGVDFPNVNTILINDAYKMGLAQIHQLRGRVGRRDEKGYCYLMYNKEKLKEDGAERLRTLVDYSYLGAGFEIAMKDLEIRGGGDILGVNQSGQMDTIGVSTYLKLLENEIEKLKIENGQVDKVDKVSTIIDLNISAFLDSELFNSEIDKINFYREIESINNIDDLEVLIDDFGQFNNNFSKTTNNFFDLLKLRILAHKHNIENIRGRGLYFEINFKEKDSLEYIKNVLDLDKKGLFSLVDKQKIRTKKSNFKNDLEFLDFALKMFLGDLKSKFVKKLNNFEKK